MKPQYVVLCMKWGNKFQANDVNILYNAVNRNLNVSHRFICLTDDTSRINPNVECFPIPEIGLKQWHWYQGAWPKLSVFLSQLYNLAGRCLFIDLDTVILDNLEPFFESSASLIGIDVGANWGRPRDKDKKVLGTGVFAFSLGSQSQIVEKFKSNRNAAVSKYAVEQAFVQDYAISVEYWPENWVISFKRHLQRRNLSGLVFKPKHPPAGTKVIAFHGNPKPSDLQYKRVWGRFPHLGLGSVNWIDDYFHKYSD